MFKDLNFSIISSKSVLDKEKLIPIIHKLFHEFHFKFRVKNVPLIERKIDTWCFNILRSFENGEDPFIDFMTDILNEMKGFNFNPNHEAFLNARFKLALTLFNEVSLSILFNKIISGLIELESTKGLDKIHDKYLGKRIDIHFTGQPDCLLELGNYIFTIEMKGNDRHGADQIIKYINLVDQMRHRGYREYVFVILLLYPETKSESFRKSMSWNEQGANRTRISNAQVISSKCVKKNWRNMVIEKMNLYDCYLNKVNIYERTYEDFFDALIKLEDEIVSIHGEKKYTSYKKQFKAIANLSD